MKRYFFGTSALILGLCVIVGLFNYLVDPFGIYHFEQASVNSLSRSEQFYHMRTTKPWYVLQANPTAIVIGSSRSAAVHPEHPTWPKNYSYNLSVPGLTIYEMGRFIEHAQANGPLSELMIGLDFETFIVPEPQFNSGFEESRMARNASDLSSPRFFWQFLTDLSETLLSLPAFTRSYSALAGTAKVDNRYFKDGSWVRTTSAANGRGGYIYFGKVNVFDSRNDKLSLDSNLKIFSDTLRFAHQHKIDTRLYITPEHVFMVDLWARLGYGELWSEFHRGLLAVNSAVAKEMGVDPFPVFGFNHIRGVVDEPIRKNRESQKSLFIDGAHFRPALGSQIMDGVWTEGSRLGIQLDADTVESYLAQVEQLRYEFEAANAKLTTFLRHEISPDLE